MKNKLIELLNDSFAKQYEKRGLLTAHHTAEDLIANGVTIGKDNNVPTGWIPVEERLPKPEQDVLVSCKQGAFKYQCTAFYIPAKWEREKSNISWDWECCEDYDEEIDDYLDYCTR